MIQWISQLLRWVLHVYAYWFGKYSRLPASGNSSCRVVCYGCLGLFLTDLIAKVIAVM